jgi:hypothetical protein
MDCANGYIMSDESRGIGRFPAMLLDCKKWESEKAAFRLTTDSPCKLPHPLWVGWLMSGGLTGVNETL